VNAHFSGHITTKGAAEPASLDLDLEQIFRYDVTKPAAYGTTDVMLSTESSSVLVGDKKVQIPISGQAVATLDASGKIIGLSGVDRSLGLFGSNLSSLLVLMLPYLPQEEFKPGETWSAELPYPMPGRKLNVRYTVAGTEMAGGKDAVRMKESFELTAYAAPAAAAETDAYSPGVTPSKPAVLRGEASSDFRISDCRLTKAKVEIRINTAGDGSKDADIIDASVKLDVNLLP